MHQPRTAQRARTTCVRARCAGGRHARNGRGVGMAGRRVQHDDRSSPAIVRSRCREVGRRGDSGARGNATRGRSTTRDLFLIYVPEDRLPLAAPLAIELTKRRVSVAFAGYEVATAAEFRRQWRTALRIIAAVSCCGQRLRAGAPRRPHRKTIACACSGRPTVCRSSRPCGVGTGSAKS